MSPRRLFVHTCVAALALASIGCSSGPPTVGDPAPALTDVQAEKAYRALLTRYTGQDEIYRGFDTYLFAGATFQTWAFREARVMRQAAFKSMTKAEIEAALAKERSDHEQYNEFVFGTWVVDPTFDDFDRKNSAWRVALVTEDGEVLPSSVERVRRVNDSIRALYPYMGQFWAQYRAKFPKTREDGTPVIKPGTKTVKLVLASSFGVAEMTVSAE